VALEELVVHRDEEGAGEEELCMCVEWVGGWVGGLM
jgi:hypothetical protein